MWDAEPPFLVSVWRGDHRPCLHPKHEPSIDGCLSSGKLHKGERALRAWVASGLVTIHPNPGPARHVTPESKAERMERRRGRRAEKRGERESRKVEEERRLREKELREIVVVVQRMSMGYRSKRKARAVAETARKQGWDVVLLSELCAEREGVVWMGEEEERVVIVHSRKAGVLLRGEMMRAWSEGGMLKKMSERHVSVKVRGVVYTATYMPPWRHGREREIEGEWEHLAEHVAWARRGEMPVVGGDFNAHVGGGEERR